MRTCEKRTVCPYDCPDACGLIAVTDKVRILSVRGDEKHPVTQGFLCRKMQHYEQDIHSPHRLKTPLKRVGEKGRRESFVPVSWEEAVAEIGTRWRGIIAQSGSDAILPYSYAGNMGTVQRNCGDAFFARLGAANLERTICSGAKEAAVNAVMGDFLDWQASHLADADLILLWGSNPRVNRLHILPYLLQAKKKGAKVVLIDIYRNHSADLCDETVLVKPGTDAALLLAMMAILDQSRALNHSFIAACTTGFLNLRLEYSAWSAQRAQAATKVPAEQIQRLAALYGHAKKPMIVAGNGMSRYTNGAAAYRLLLCLPAITGAWKRGGGTCGLTGSSSFLDKTIICRPDWKKPGLRTFNMNRLGSALLDKKRPIRSLYVYHSNPAVMAPDQRSVCAGLKREDLFLIVHDRFLTDTALYADLVLPATFSVEQDDLFSCYGSYHLQLSPRILAPFAQAKSNWDVFCLLAREMGFTDDYFQSTASEMAEQILCALEEKSASGTALSHLSPSQAAKLRQGYAVLLAQPDVLRFQTEDGRIHLAPKRPCYTPLSDRKYPLRLAMVHTPWSLNSNFSYREELMEKRGPLTLCIHPLEAAARGIRDGEAAYAFNDQGKITVIVSATKNVPPGTAIAAGVYQNSLTFKDGNFSSLISQSLTDAGRAAALNTHSVELCRK